MRRAVLCLIVGLEAGSAPLAAQVPYIEWATEWEVRVVQPPETSPARYTQVAEEEIQGLALQG